MSIISILGILIGLAFLILTSWRGWSIYICGIGASIIVMIFSRLNVLEALAGPFMSGFTTFASNYLILFLVSTIFAKIMGDSGAAKVIAVKVANLSRKAKPENQQMVALFLLNLIMIVLTYGGVNVFVIVFLMAALCKDIFKEMDIPWHLYMAIAGSGTATITVSMMPGTPSPLNLIPTNYLGTTATAAPVMGIICSVACFILSWIYVVFALKRANRRKEGYLPTGAGIEARDGLKMDYTIANYNVFYCLIPCIALLVLMNVVGLSPITSMAISCLLGIIMFHKTLPLKNLPETFKGGCENAISTCMNVCVVVGFGSVVASTAGYEYILGALNNIAGSPIIQLVIAVFVACGVSGSSTGGMTIALNQLADKFLATGMNPQVIHRVACIAATGLDTLPHNAGVLVSYQVTSLNYKQGYIHTFMTCCVIPVIITFLAVLLSTVGIV